MIARKRARHAGFACALPIIALLAAQSAYATPSPAGPAGPAGPAKAAATAAASTRNVSYNGVRVSVPATWPVIDLRLHPGACVRLDRSGLYLGSPGPQSQCPAHAIGRADTIWLKPAAAAQTDRLSAPSPQVTKVGALAARVGVDQVSHDKQAQFVTANVELDATWGTDSSSIDRVLATAVVSPGSSTPASSASPTPPTKPIAGATSAAGPAQPAAPTAPTPATAAESVFTGMAFDTCAAPSTSTMSSWISSPYRSAGIYIGGSMRACSDGNLSAGWVTSVHSMGWSLLPIYVGAQAPCVNQGQLATFSSSSARSTGINSAFDAVTQARRFGMGAGTPIYYDMEAYNNSAAGCSQTVMAFVSAWTSELHALGYKSGTYGSSASLMVDMSRAAGTAGFVQPDDVWFADWNQLQTTSEQARYPGFPDMYWSLHQRVHQYAGGANQSWGGATLNIDANWVNGAVAGTAAPMSYGTNIVGPGGAGFVLTGSMTYWRSGAPSGLNRVAYWTHFNGTSEGNGATWSPQLAPGRYDVEACIPASSTASARYSIKDAVGSTVKVLSQASTGYRSLGTFTAGSGSSISVHLSDVGASSANPQVWADAMAFRRVSTTPGAPGAVHAVAGTGQAVVNWAAAAGNGSPITGYTVTASPGGARVLVSGAHTTATVIGLTGGRAYTFTVTATSAAGTSPSSAASNAVTPRATTPQAPTSVSGAAGNAAAVVTWTAPGSNGGSGITRYTVTASPGGRSATTTGATTGTVTGLVNGSAYSFTVTAANALGTSPASSPSGSVTPMTIPQAPTGVGAQAGNAEAIVTWIAPTNNGGSAITRYTVTASPGGRSATTTGAGAGAATVSGLANNTSYTFSITASNAAGTSLGSSPSPAITPMKFGFTAMAPARVVLDTRVGVGAPKAKLGAGHTLTLTIPGLAAGATAVALNVTATNPTAPGWLAVYPGSRSRPNASNLNFAAGQTIANMVVVPLGPGNTVTFYNLAGTVNLIASVLGTYR